MKVDSSVDCGKHCADYTGLTAGQMTDKNGKTWYFLLPQGIHNRGRGS
jgi:hypothetical protein